MAHNLVPRFPILLALSALNDEALRTLVGQITVAAATSTLVANNPAMAACVAVIVAKADAFAKSSKTVVEDRAKLHQDIAAQAEDRTALIGDLRTYLAFVSSDARTPADIQGVGLVCRDTSIPRLPPAPPELLDVIIPQKGRGKVVVAVQGTGGPRCYYDAEQSADGITWTPLGHGRGKTRTLTGPSGTKIWVRFARVRGSERSEFCTPQLVTIP
jgi:hypothetical protein